MAQSVLEFPFCGPSYPAISTVLDAQRAINLYPETALQTSESQIALIGTPGLSAPLVTLANSPVRALWAGNGRLFAVGGNHFYEISPNTGAVLTDYGAMAGDAGGISDLRAPCQVVANGTQLLVMNSVSQQIYNANSVGPAMNSVFNGVALEYLDGFYVAIATGASLAGSNPNQINTSALGDGTSWPGLAVALRTGSADLTTQLAVVNEQLWIFGQKRIEVWYNAGTSPFPFARIQGATIDQGLLAPFSVVKLDNTLFWLGSDDRGVAVVYRANGFQPERVSNHAIEQLIQYSGAIGAGINAFGYQEDGHTFYVLNLAGANSGHGAAVVYDLTTKMWHERYFYNVGTLEVPRAYCFASVNSTAGAGGGTPTALNFVGDRNTGAIYQMGLQYTNDNTTAIQRIRTAPHLSDKRRWVKYRSLEIVADIGTAAMTLSYSNDGGKTYGTLARSDATTAGMNNQGTGSNLPTAKRYRWWQLGRSLQRSFKVTILDANNPIRLIEATVGVK